MFVQCFLVAVPQPEGEPQSDLPRKHALAAVPGPAPKRSKKGKKAKNGNRTIIPELNPSDYVRVVKVTNKEDLLHEGPVLLSKVDKAGQMLLTQDRLSVTSSKGYRMVTTNWAWQCLCNTELAATLPSLLCIRSIGSCHAWRIPRHMVF